MENATNGDPGSVHFTLSPTKNGSLFITASSNGSYSRLSPGSERVLFGTFYFLLASPSFTLHVLVFLSLLKVQGSIRHFHPFYILLTNHYLADVVKILFYLLFACPCIWAGRQVYGAGLGDVLGEFESVDYIAILMSTFLMSVNRALAIGAPSLNEDIFTKRLCIVYNCLTWVAGCLVSVINRSLSCPTVLLEKKYVFSTVCTHKPAASPGSIVVYIFVYGVIAFYLFAIFSLATRGKRVDNADVERNVKGYQMRLFFQALFIWTGVVGNAIAFRIIPLFTPGIGTVMATGIVIIGQSYITPVTMLVFVNDTRNGVKQLLSCNHKTAVTKLTKPRNGDMNSGKQRLNQQMLQMGNSYGVQIVGHDIHYAHDTID